MHRTLSQLKRLHDQVEEHPWAEPSMLEPYRDQEGRLEPPQEWTQEDQARFCWYTGDVALAAGLVAEAVGCFERLLLLEERIGEPPPGLACTWARLGRARFCAGLIDQGHEAFRRSLELSEQPWTHYLYATVLTGTQAYQTATPHWEEAIAQYALVEEHDVAANVRLQFAKHWLDAAHDRFQLSQSLTLQGAPTEEIARPLTTGIHLMRIAHHVLDEALADPHLSPFHPLRFTCLTSLGTLYHSGKKPEEALRQYRAALNEPASPEQQAEIQRRVDDLEARG